MSKCMICENLYPQHYKECPICKAELVPEKFAPQPEKEDVVKISPFVEAGEIKGDEL